MWSSSGLSSLGEESDDWKRCCVGTDGNNGSGAGDVGADEPDDAGPGIAGGVVGSRAGEFVTDAAGGVTGESDGTIGKTDDVTGSGAGELGIEDCAESGEVEGDADDIACIGVGWITGNAGREVKFFKGRWKIGCVVPTVAGVAKGDLGPNKVRGEVGVVAVGDVGEYVANDLRGVANSEGGGGLEYTANDFKGLAPGQVEFVVSVRWVVNIDVPILDGGRGRTWAPAPVIWLQTICIFEIQNILENWLKNLEFVLKI